MANSGVNGVDAFNITNYLDKLRAANESYGLTKEESDALNRERVAQSTKRALIALGVLGGIAEPGITLSSTLEGIGALANAGAVTGDVGIMLSRQLGNDFPQVQSAVKKMQATRGNPTPEMKDFQKYVLDSTSVNSFLKNLRNK